MQQRQRSLGFTLIEVMVVVAIIGILAAIGYPSYQNQVQKTRRADAKAALMEFAQGAERYYTQNGDYDGYVPPFDESPRDSSNKFYDLVFAPNDQSFDLSADAEERPRGRCLRHTDDQSDWHQGFGRQQRELLGALRYV